MSEELKRSACPISCSLDIVGDKWSLLILRDMIFYDKSTFGEFLVSKEGIATNVLTDKLKSLTAEGVIFKHTVPGKARVGYSLTQKGICLVPAIHELWKWGYSYAQPEGTTSHKVPKYSNAHLKKLMLDLENKLAEKMDKITVIA